MIALLNKKRIFCITMIMIILISIPIFAAIPNNPILYRETGGTRSYLHEIEFPPNTTTKTVSTTASRLWSTVRVNFDRIISWSIPTQNLSSAGIYIPMTVANSHAVIGQAVYLDPNFRCYPADANSISKMPCAGLLAQDGYGASKQILIQGLIRNNAWAWIRGPVYISSDPNTTSGLSQTAPAPGAYGYKQCIGYAIDPNVLVITGDQTLIH